MAAVSWTKQQVNLYTNPNKLTQEIKANPSIAYARLIYLFRLAYASEKKFQARLPDQKQTELQTRLFEAAQKSGVFEWASIVKSNQPLLLESIQKACLKMNEPCALAFIQLGLPITQADLFSATQNNCLVVAQEILKRHPGFWQQSWVFTWACNAGAVAIVQSGLERGIQPTSADLEAAVRNNQKEVVKLLKDKGFLYTWMHLEVACDCGHTDLAHDLIMIIQNQSKTVGNPISALKSVIRRNLIVAAKFLIQN